MRLFSYAGDQFWSGLEWLGLEDLLRGIPNRKLQLVYIHWSILLIALVVNVVAVAMLIRRSNELRRAAPPWATFVVLVYCLIAGLFFFNRMVFTHAMLQWPWQNFVLSMLGSVAVAVAPVWLLYVVGASDREAVKVPGRVYLALIPVLHSLMTIIYVLNPGATE